MSKILSLQGDANFYLYRKPVKMSRSFDYPILSLFRVSYFEKARRDS
jgi:hypothetical protein